MGVILALAAAAVYGAGDFFGGLATKRDSVFTVVPLTGLFGLATALIAVPVFSPGAPSVRDLELGALVGLFGGIAIACLYRGLAIGSMSVVAPITAVIAAVVPVGYGLMVGERPSAIVITGIVLAIGAVGLISSSSHEDVSGRAEPSRAGLLEAFLAGCGFGLLYVFLSQTSRGMWPLVAARVVSVASIGLVALVLRRFTTPAPKSIRTMACSGILDMGGNVLYLLSLRYTLISVAAVITSLYPASTVMLARMVLGEKLGRLQWIGVGCAVVGIALIAHG
ncbi:MAG TPA: DMT family transporter [Candidatus Eremiobacteraceae bacterium]|nr:DMT family transporter [Candidatus Eremiobacteraceae bacterium]